MIIHHYYKLLSKESGLMGNKMGQEYRILIHPNEKKLPKDFDFTVASRKIFLELREKYGADQEGGKRKTRKEIIDEMVRNLKKEYRLREIKLHAEY